MPTRRTDFESLEVGQHIFTNADIICTIEPFFGLVTKKEKHCLYLKRDDGMKTVHGMLWTIAYRLVEKDVWFEVV